MWRSSAPSREARAGAGGRTMTALLAGVPGLALVEAGSGSRWTTPSSRPRPTPRRAARDRPGEDPLLLARMTRARCTRTWPRSWPGTRSCWWTGSRRCSWARLDRYHPGLLVRADGTVEEPASTRAPPHADLAVLLSTSGTTRARQGSCRCRRRTSRPTPARSRVPRPRARANGAIASLPLPLLLRAVGGEQPSRGRRNARPHPRGPESGRFWDPRVPRLHVVRRRALHLQPLRRTRSSAGATRHSAP